MKMKDADSIAITKVVFKVAGKELEMTVNEAKELMRLLNDTFGHTTQYVPYYPYYPWRYWATTADDGGTITYSAAATS